MEFQFLIGRLAVEAKAIGAVRIKMFQFLIGRLAVDLDALIPEDITGFNSS